MGCDSAPLRRGAPWLALWAGAAVSALLLILSGCGSSDDSAAGLPAGRATLDQILRGRQLVMGGACADCHNRGKVDPGDPNWLGGYMGPPTGGPPGSFVIGPPPGFKTFAANITPDTATGIGRYTDRQLFNELRYGLDPASTPSVVITSTTPGQGNYPANPVYLAPPMPWPSFRHLPDADLWAIVAYVKHGILPVSNQVPESETPPGGWASFYTPDQIGPFPLPAYPAAHEHPSP